MGGGSLEVDIRAKSAKMDIMLYSWIVAMA